MTDASDSGRQEGTTIDGDLGALHEAIHALGKDDPFDRWVEVVAAAVLALATIASAWSAYQATRWSAAASAAFAEASALRAESVRSSDVADADFTVDVEYFSIWLEAETTGNEELGQRIEDSFRSEFTVAFDAWLEAEPLNDPDAPNTPFDMDEYELAAASEADALQDRAEIEAKAAVEADEDGDRYVQTTVVFATVLFFAGISTKFRGRSIKLALSGLGLAAFAAGGVILLTLPVR